MSDTSKQSQPKTGSLGEIVEDLEELEQCLIGIVTTEVGTVPGRRGFGIRYDEIIDAPIELARVAATREVNRAVRENSRRIEIDSVSLATPDESGALSATIHWHPAGQPALSKQTEVRFA